VLSVYTAGPDGNEILLVDETVREELEGEERVILPDTGGECSGSALVSSESFVFEFVSTSSPREGRSPIHVQIHEESDTTTGDVEDVGSTEDTLNYQLENYDWDATVKSWNGSQF
jgi:hypothetical protein